MKLIEIVGHHPFTSPVKRLLKDCAPYLKEISYDLTEHRLFRGMHGASLSTMFSKYPVMKDRLPLDTDEKLHDHADDWFYKKFKIRFRTQATFASGSQRVAEEYGDPFIIFPIGKFDYCYSNIYGDMTNALMDGLQKMIEQVPRDQKQHVIDDVDGEYAEEILEDGHYKLNTGLATFITKYPKSEVMIHCDYYYALPIRRFEDEYRAIAAEIKEQW
jgi:hypothetical protein